MERHPGFGVHLRIVNGDSQFQVVMVHAVESFFYTQIVAMRTAHVIEPSSVIRPSGLDHQGVVVHPLAYRIPEPTRFRVFGGFSSVGPDDPPYLVELVEKDH